MTKAATVMMAVLIVLITAALGLWVWSLATGRATSHDQIIEEQQRVEQQLTYISCLLLTPSRTPEAIASCQVEP